MDCIKLCIENFVRHSQSQSLRSRMQGLAIQDDQYMLVTCGPQPRAQSPLSRLFPTLVRNKLSDAAQLSHTSPAFEYPDTLHDGQCSEAPGESRPFGYHPNWTAEEELSVIIGWELLDALSADTFLAVTRELQAVNCAPHQTFARAYNVALRLIHRRLSVGADLTSGIMGYYPSMNVPVHIVGFTGYLSASLGVVRNGVLEPKLSSFAEACHRPRAWLGQGPRKPDAAQMSAECEDTDEGDLCMDSSYLRWNIRMSCIFVNIPPQKNIYSGGVAPLDHHHPHHSQHQHPSLATSCACSGSSHHHRCTCQCNACPCNFLCECESSQGRSRKTSTRPCACAVRRQSLVASPELAEACQDAKLLPHPLPSAALSTPLPIPFAPMTELSASSPIFLWKVLKSLLPECLSHSLNKARSLNRGLLAQQLSALGDWGLLATLERLALSHSHHSTAYFIHRKLSELMRYYCGLTSIGGLINSYLRTASVLRDHEELVRAGDNNVSQPAGLLPPLVPTILKPSVAGVLLPDSLTKPVQDTSLVQPSYTWERKRRHAILVPIGSPLGSSRSLHTTTFSPASHGSPDAFSSDASLATKELSSYPPHHFDAQQKPARALTCVSSEEREFLRVLRKTTGRAITLSSLRQINDVISGLDYGFGISHHVASAALNQVALNAETRGNTNRFSTFAVIRMRVPCTTEQRNVGADSDRPLSLRVWSSHTCPSASMLLGLSSQNSVAKFPDVSSLSVTAVPSVPERLHLDLALEPAISQVSLFLRSQVEARGHLPSMNGKNPELASPWSQRGRRMLHSLTETLKQIITMKHVNQQSNCCQSFPLYPAQGLPVLTNAWLPTALLRCGLDGCPRHPLPAVHRDSVHQPFGALPVATPVHPCYNLDAATIPNPKQQPLRFFACMVGLALHDLRDEFSENDFISVDTEVQRLNHLLDTAAPESTVLKALTVAAEDILQRLKVDEYIVDLTGSLYQTLLRDPQRTSRLVRTPNVAFSTGKESQVCFGWLSVVRSLNLSTSTGSHAVLAVAPYDFPKLLLYVMQSRWLGISSSLLGRQLLMRCLSSQCTPEHCIESVAEALVRMGVSENDLINARLETLHMSSPERLCSKCLDSEEELAFCGSIERDGDALFTQALIPTVPKDGSHLHPRTQDGTRTTAPKTKWTCLIHCTRFSTLSPSGRQTKSSLLLPRLSAPAARALARHVVQGIAGLVHDIFVSSGQLTLFPELASSVLEAAKLKLRLPQPEQAGQTSQQPRQRMSNRLHRRRFLLQSLKQAIPSFNIELALANLAAADELEQDELARTGAAGMAEDLSGSTTTHALGALPALLFQTTYHSLRLADLASMPMSRLNRVDWSSTLPTSQPAQRVPFSSNTIQDAGRLEAQASVGGASGFHALRNDSSKPDASTLDQELEALVRFLQPNQRSGLMKQVKGAQSALQKSGASISVPHPQQQQQEQQQLQPAPQERSTLMLSNSLDELNVFGYLLPSVGTLTERAAVDSGLDESDENDTDSVMADSRASGSASEDSELDTAETSSGQVDHPSAGQPSAVGAGRSFGTASTNHIHVEDNEDLTPATFWQHHLGVRGLQHLRPRAPPIRLLPDYVRFAARQLWNAGGAETPVRSQGLEIISPAERLEGSQRALGQLNSTLLGRNRGELVSNYFGLLGAGALVHSPYSLLSVKRPSPSGVSTAASGEPRTSSLAARTSSFLASTQSTWSGRPLESSTSTAGVGDTKARSERASEALDMKRRARLESVQKYVGRSLDWALSTEFSALLLTEHEMANERIAAIEQSEIRRGNSPTSAGRPRLINSSLVPYGAQSSADHTTKRIARPSFVEFCRHRARLQRTKGLMCTDDEDEEYGKVDEGGEVTYDDRSERDLARKRKSMIDSRSGQVDSISTKRVQMM